MAHLIPKTHFNKFLLATSHNSVSSMKITLLNHINLYTIIAKKKIYLILTGIIQLVVKSKWLMLWKDYYNGYEFLKFYHLHTHEDSKASVQMCKLTITCSQCILRLLWHQVCWKEKEENHVKSFFCLVYRLSSIAIILRICKNRYI